MADSEKTDLTKEERERLKKEKEKQKKKEKEKAKKEAEKAKKSDTKDGKGPAGPKKAGPSKAALAQILALQAAAKEEEERLQKEEEERIRREEEAEKERLEKERLEQERKERKKQKEKERLKRLKAEGKLLTDKQKADLKRAKATLELLQQQGIVIGKGNDTESSKDGTTGKSVKAAKPKIKTLSQIQKEKATNASTDEALNQGEKSISPDTEPISGDTLDDDDNKSEEVADNWEEIEEILSNDSVDENGNEDDEDSSSDKSDNVQRKAPVIKTLAEDTKKLSIRESKSAHNLAQHEKVSSLVSSKSVVEKLSESARQEFRSPIVCVLGHVDTGKTKLLDYIRRSHVQDNEAGGITQQIGATFVPDTAVDDQCRNLKVPPEMKMPGLLIIDTPGHESFTNLRSRGSSLCDIAILVIDIMHGLEPQTIESLNLLKSRKTPFIVALNKIDRIYGWKVQGQKGRDIEDIIKSQAQNSQMEFKTKLNETILQLNEQGMNAALFYENPDPREFISLVPTSAHTGEGMGNLIGLIVSICQTWLRKKIPYDPDNLDATVLEIKQIAGLGTTMDVILVNGTLHEKDRIILAGHDGPIVTEIRALLVPQPLKELRIKSPYQELKQVSGSIGVKIAGHDLERAIAGLPLWVGKTEPEVERAKAQCMSELSSLMRSIKTTEKGVHVQASTLGSLEALCEFLKVSKVPYASVRIGPVVKKDVMKASSMLEIAPEYAMILAFDVKIERDAQELADHLHMKIFQAEIIYHLFDAFTAYQNDIKEKKKQEFRSRAVFPAKVRVLPQFIFNSRDPIVLGVCIEDGVLIPGTPIAVPSKESLILGIVTTIENNHKPINEARRGMEVCIKIENAGGDAPKMYGRHFDHTDMLCSRITRESIDICKEYFRDELQKSDWQLMIELKKLYEII